MLWPSFPLGKVQTADTAVKSCSVLCRNRGPCTLRKHSPNELHTFLIQGTTVARMGPQMLFLQTPSREECVPPGLARRWSLNYLVVHWVKLGALSVLSKHPIIEPRLNCPFKSLNLTNG